jgi:hypothetical protein
VKKILSCLIICLLIAACHKEDASSTHPHTPSQAPVITSFAPLSGSANTVVTIRGKNFNAVTTGDTVKFNGTAAVIQSATDTALTVFAPAAGTNGAITVSTTKGKATGSVFAYGPDVFIIGTVYSNTYIPVLWKNGAPFYLSGNKDYGFATGMAVIDTNIYVSGYIFDSGGFQQGRYWKNLAEANLSEGLIRHTTAGMAVSGNDMYVTGFQEADLQIASISIAEYWKNGKEILLSDTTQDAHATAVAVNGNDVYVTGDTKPPNSYLANYVAAVWKNGVQTKLPTVGQSSYTTGITISNNDVYISGYDYNGTTTAKYWKNGTPVMMNGNGVATAITVAGNDVYLAGYIDNGTYDLATYWKNGVPVSLTDGTAYNGVVTSIAVLGNDVYAVGYECSIHNPVVAPAFLGYAAICWKNGVRIVLNDTRTQSQGYASQVILKPHVPYH